MIDLCLYSTTGSKEIVLDNMICDAKATQLGLAIDFVMLL